MKGAEASNNRTLFASIPNRHEANTMVTVYKQS